MISTRDLSELPEPGKLKRLCQSIAMLDAILMPEWQYRYYSFNSKWAPKKAMASMRNGCGGQYFIVFCEHGAVIKGFDLHCKIRVSSKGILNGLPKELVGVINDPAFTIDETTFCIWRGTMDNRWQSLVLPALEDNADGSADLLGVLDAIPETYHRWAQDYYERSVDLSAVKAIYAHAALTPELLAKLNADVTMHTVAADRDELGYGV